MPFTSWRPRQQQIVSDQGGGIGVGSPVFRGYIQKARAVGSTDISLASGSGVVDMTDMSVTLNNVQASSKVLITARFPIGFDATGAPAGLAVGYLFKNGSELHVFMLTSPSATTTEAFPAEFCFIDESPVVGSNTYKIRWWSTAGTKYQNGATAGQERVIEAIEFVPPGAFSSVVGTTDVEKNGTTVVDMTDMSVTVNVGANKVLVVTTQPWASKLPDPVDPVTFQVTRDGTIIAFKHFTKRYDSNPGRGFMSNFVLLDDPGSGSHTYKVRWAAGDASGTIVNRPTSSGFQFHRRMWAMEVKN